VIYARHFFTNIQTFCSPNVELTTTLLALTAHRGTNTDTYISAEKIVKKNCKFLFDVYERTVRSKYIYSTTKIS